MQRSSKCVEDHATALESRKARAYGGVVSRSVTVLSYPSVLMIEDRKYVKDWPVVSIICMKVSM